MKGNFMKSKNALKCFVFLGFVLFSALVHADFKAVKDYQFLPCSPDNIARFYHETVKEQKEARALLEKKYADCQFKPAIFAAAEIALFR